MSIDNNSTKENFQLPPQIPTAFGGAGGIDLSSYVNANQSPLVAFILSQSYSQINSIKQAILRSIFQLTEFRSSSGSSGSPGTSPEDLLVSSYNNLLARVSAYTPSADSPISNSSTISDFRKELYNLDSQKKKFISKKDSGIFNIAKSAAHYYISLILYILGPIFAIILILNKLYYLKRITHTNYFSIFIHKVFYAFWAGIWYPLILLYGIVDPPIFRTFFPFYKVEKIDNFFQRPFTYIFQRPFTYTSSEPNPISENINKNVMRVCYIILFCSFLYVYIFYDDF
uniref:Uncharacterized protein n=1 Tax=viral metagenome TaxID=1070528 RepID=A0A6C0K3V6_9ZZZZ